MMCAVAVVLREGPRTLFVDFAESDDNDFPGSPAVALGNRWLRILGAADVAGLVHRDNLTAANLREIEQQLAGAA